MVFGGESAVLGEEGCVEVARGAGEAGEGADVGDGAEVFIGAVGG